MLYQISDVGVQNMMFTDVKSNTRSRCTNTISNPTITYMGAGAQNMLCSGVYAFFQILHVVIQNI